MKTLIAYAGRGSTSRQMAERIAAGFSHDAEVLNLRRQTAPALNEYDRLIIGGSILAGSVPKALKKFIQENSNVILSKRLGLFLCCLMEKDVEQYFRSNFPEPLYSHAADKRWLGGELIMRNHNFIVQKMLQKVMGSSDDIHNLRWEEADRLAAAIGGNS
ncbi:MAG: flavodoxin domain-containing protein [Spirochaetota bacterium]